MPTPPVPKSDDVLSRLDELTAKLDTERKMREVTDHIHNLSLDDIILSVREDVQRLVNCERVTIFAKEPAKEEIYSKSMDGSEVKEIRLAVGATSLAGYVAQKKKPIRIADVYDPKSVSAVDPALRFDPSWDKKTGFKTKQVLATPILKEGKLVGVIECVNTRDGMAFRIDHEVIVDDLAKTLGTAFQNQQKINVRTSPYDGLIRAGRITQDQVDQATALSQKNNTSVEQALLSTFKVPREEILRSLSDFFRCPSTAYSKEVVIPGELLEKFTIDYLKHHGFVPIQKTGNRVTIAMTNPRNLTLRDDIARRLGLEVVVNVAIREDVNEFIDYFLGQKTQPAAVPAVAFSEIIDQIESEDAEHRKPEEGRSEEAVKEDDVGMVRLVNQLIEQAHDKG
ncbi:MAG TPA: GAF domain-containing protein, partial [Planctomycetota bacterium]|nr:GAF domain-containing protein [Planctomycetota bacterium]